MIQSLFTVVKNKQISAANPMTERAQRMRARKGADCLCSDVLYRSSSGSCINVFDHDGRLRRLKAMLSEEL